MTDDLSPRALERRPLAQPSAPAAARPRLPEWLRVQLPSGRGQQLFQLTQGAVQGNGLHTVCEEARCPNIHDCWAQGTATFMIAGDACTRGCRFCSVQTLKAPPAPDPLEPQRLAAAVGRLRLDHVVITVVNRDDLADGGAAHYRRCIDAVAEAHRNCSIELLCSDLEGNHAALGDLLAEAPLAVFAHNVECVERLDRTVRDPRASFARSLQMLREAKRLRPDVCTKTSLMAGLGETDDELAAALRRLREADVDVVTLGQYLPPGRPGDRFLPVARYVAPDAFAAWERYARQLGFRGVAAGPLVRSSYRAAELLASVRAARG
jgi:lipoic acid synthetase